MLRKLDLQPPLACLRPAREHIEDQRSPVDDLHVIQCFLQIALLRGRELVVADDRIDAVALDVLENLVDLALADVGLRGLVEPLGDGARDAGAGAAGKLSQLLDRVSQGQRLPPAPDLDPDEQGSLPLTRGRQLLAGDVRLLRAGRPAPGSSTKRAGLPRGRDRRPIASATA